MATQKGWGLRAKLSAAFVLVSLLIVAFYAFEAYRLVVESEMKGVDQKLLTAAHATQRMVGEGFHDRLAADDPNKLSTTRRLTAFVHDSGLAYV